MQRLPLLPLGNPLDYLFLYYYDVLFRLFSDDAVVRDECNYENATNCSRECAINHDGGGGDDDDVCDS